MAQLIGQCYNAELSLKDSEGKFIKFTSDNWEEKLSSADKVRFSVNIGSRKAFADEDSSMVFTKAVTFQKGLAKVLYKHFGQDEHHGKWIALNGHFDEFEWTPDPDNNPSHEKFMQKETLTKELLEQVGFKFAEGSPEKVTIEFAPKQISRQLVVNGFEFVGNNESTSSKSSSTKKSGTVRIAGSSSKSSDEDSDVNSDVKNTSTPF